MTREEIIENLSDIDLELAIKEMRKFDNRELAFKDTMVLCEVYNSLEEIKGVFRNEPVSDTIKMCTWLAKEYSYRKAGLK